MEKTGEKYNLEERTAKFGESIIGLCRKIRQDNIIGPIINQLVRSGTSIGANYMEANGASSKRDLVNKILICKKESQETKHWIRTPSSCGTPEIKDKLRELWKESQELTLIFQKIISSARNKN